MYDRAAKSTAILAGIYTAIALAEWVLTFWFSKSNFGPKLIEQQVVYTDWMGYLVFRYTDKLIVFGVCCALALAKLFVLFWLLFSLRPALKQMIREHTGSIDEVGDGTVKSEEVRKQLRRLLTVVMVLAAAAVLYSAVTTVIYLWFPILPTFDLFMWVVFACLIYYFTDKLKTCIDDRYYYET